MNANVATARRWRGVFALALGGFLCVAARPGPASAQSLSVTLRRADELYRADKLPQAETLYRQALNTADGTDRRHCSERLLDIYAQVGRPDQAIQTGLDYERWLRRVGDLARARELALDLGHWHLVLGHFVAAESHLRRALAEVKGAALPPARQVVALTYLALAAEKKGDRAQAGQAWRDVEAFALAWLDDPRREFDMPLRIACVCRLVDSYRFQGRAKEAILRLEKILPAFDGLKKPDPVGLRDALRQLAAHLKAVGRLADAEKRLKEALALHRQQVTGDPVTLADLSWELADVLERQGQTKEAAPHWGQAARQYRAALADSRAGALVAFWKLHELYQRTSQYQRALKLTQGQAEQWAGGLIEPRLHAEQGRLHVLLGEYAPSRPLLAGAVRDLEGQSPLNLVELPAALLTLGVAELATGDRARAEKAGRRCLDLYRVHGLPDDLVLVEAYNLLGNCTAHDGDYAEAIKHFRAGVGRCPGLGPAADRPHYNLLLNIALLLKAQGDQERALIACRDARSVYQRFAAPDALGFAALDAAAAAILAARARLDEANALAPKILERCRKHDIVRGPLVLTARHCQALFHLPKRNFDAAERAWREVEELHGPKSPLRPRTLNYLGLTREAQGRTDDAVALYRAAQKLQAQNPRAFPVTHFTTLWRLASLADRRGERAEARALLEGAVAVVEKARLRTYGDAQQRAAFFAQFAPAFEQLVAWAVRDGDVPAAVIAVARGRSRTLLDQLLLANIDPRQGLQGPQGEELRRREEGLRKRIAALRARALLITPESLDTEKARRLLTDLDAAQRDYSEAYREILNASPVYRNLAGQEFTAATLRRLRDRALGPKKLLLVYHVGRRESHLLLLGDRSAEAFALTVPAAVAERAAPPAPPLLADVLGRTRGIRLKAELGQPDLPPPAAAAAAVPLGQDVLRALVGHYLQQVSDPTFRPTRGLRLQPRGATRPLPAQRPELLADVVLPAAARVRIRELAPECLIVVPDGALHKLPFEALLLKAGERPVYALDELPPLVYAPSVAVLARLADQPPAAPAGLRSLLTVADPAYPRAAKGGPQGLWDQFLPLPHTREESVRISRCFDPAQVLALRGDRATEKALAEGLAGRHVVHIAAHGITDDRFGNLFGALVLTPSAGRAAPGDDGFLELHEIQTLPLDRCELAVLSACNTNVGPQRALEAGVTLVVPFLAAGARRVVASHWSVDDESTAELMARFFREVTAVNAGRPAAYARALRDARRQVRARAGWSVPYFWAPFVLVGPPDGTGVAP